MNSSEEEERKKAERLEKFKALKAKAKKATSDNRKDLYNEHKKQSISSKERQRLERRKEDAEVELAKLDAEEAGEDFDRKRAWDWTVEEAERWDEKQRLKKKAKEDSQDDDFTTIAERSYAKKVRDMEVDSNAYEKEKDRGVDQVYEHKPNKKAVDKLINGMTRKNTKRPAAAKGEDGSVTSFINEKNKIYNKELSRHYDKYNSDVREALERQDFET